MFMSDYLTSFERYSTHSLLGTTVSPVTLRNLSLSDMGIRTHGLIL